jgi:hypothetical protein
MRRQACSLVADEPPLHVLPHQVQQQSIHSVRLQQICPARKRRRFLRRRASAPPGETFIHKNAILIIGAAQLDLPFFLPDK